jgi:putative oxygen-independent coproporphyrinogen III oxidase
MKSLAVYMHWPFCRSKCPYCDFNSHVAATIDHNAWREAYRKEIAHYAALVPGRQISSVFFGGGTPSLMEAKTVEVILGELRRHWSFANEVEITLEANPNSAEAGTFSAFHAAGVNRLSLGVQSLYDDALKFLGRGHNSAEAKQAIALADKYFPRFSFDIIYARKDQTLASWEKELREALELANAHLSLYQLTIENGTQFHTLTGRGEKLISGDDDAAAMYELTQDILGAAGLPAYEVSNYAKPGNESRHNLTYWHYDDYIGIGPGAHGRYRLDGARYATEDHRAPEVWLRLVKEQGNGIRVRDVVDNETAQREALMMGLRLTSGIDLQDWQEKFSASFDAAVLPEKIQRLEQEGYLLKSPQNLKATPAGLQRLNAVLGYLAN